MMRILSPRSVWTTTSILAVCDRPKMMNRFSACECAGSYIGTNGNHAQTPRRKENCGNSKMIADNFAALRLCVRFYAAPLALEWVPNAV